MRSDRPSPAHASRSQRPRTEFQTRPNLLRQILMIDDQSVLSRNRNRWPLPMRQR